MIPAMKLLVLFLLAAAANAAADLPSGTVESSRIRLAAQDAAGALADAEAAVARGGGAGAYAARADAKRALGRPIEEVLSDYARAAALDPRYIEKYQGLVAQRDSERDPRAAAKKSGKGLPRGANSVAEVLGVTMLGGLMLAAALVLLRGRGDAG
jgi:hypothetical protein